MSEVPPRVNGHDPNSPARELPVTRQELHFNELYVEMTYRCNAACAHCYVSSSPRASEDRLPVELLTAIISQAARIPAIGDVCAFAGGEPTLHWDDLLRLIEHAAGQGMRPLLVTNGWWGRSPETARDRLEVLVERGLQRLEVSVSAFHAPFVRHTAASTLLETAADFPIETHIQARYGRSDEAATVRWAKAVDPSVSTSLQPIWQIGRAADAIDPSEFRGEPGLPAGACHTDLSLVITPKGDVYPCCCGSELTDALKLGSVKDGSQLDEIVARTQEWDMLRQLVVLGPTALVRHMDPVTRKRLEAGSYTSICELCTQIFADPGLTAQAVRTTGLRSTSPDNCQSRPEVSGPRWLRELGDSLDLEGYSEDALWPQPSGAFILALDRYVVKAALPPAASKLREQVAWIRRARAGGIASVPEVVAVHELSDGGVAYVMPRYSTNRPQHLDEPGLAARLIQILQACWRVETGVGPDSGPRVWLPYARHVHDMLAEYDTTSAKRLLNIARVLERRKPMRARPTPLFLHGDATFENVVFDSKGAVVLLDPNPQPPVVPLIPEFDVAKVLQSLFGWERFVAQETDRLDWEEGLWPIVDHALGDQGRLACSWLLVCHLVRSLPYGAKVGRASKLLPTIEEFLDRVEELARP